MTPTTPWSPAGRRRSRRRSASAGSSLSARVERERSLAAVATSGVNDFLGGDGIFPANPPIREGTFGGGGARLAHTGGTRWALNADVLGGAGTTTVRGWAELRRDVGGPAGATLRAKAG